MAYHIGDKIRVVTPRIVARVGYPLTVSARYAEFRANPRVIEAMVMLGILPEGSRDSPSKALSAFARGCSEAAVRAAGFGGNERSLHFLDAPWLTTAEPLEVLRKRVVQTGTYYPPSGGKYWTDCGWEYEYEPGGLDDRKTHVLLSTIEGELLSSDVAPVA